MKEAAYILFFVLLSGLLYPEQTKPSHAAAQGTYIVTADVIDKQGILTNLITADTIFVYGKWALESKVKIHLLEINGVQMPRNDVFDGLYLIDLRHMSFCDLTSDTDVSSITFKPLSTKKLGYNFYGEDGLFHHESFKATRTTLNGMPAQKISYIINDGPYQNKAITVYTTVGKKTTEPLVLNPKMEELFKGRILEMHIDLNEQGTLIIKHLFSIDIKDDRMKYLAGLKG